MPDGDFCAQGICRVFAGNLAQCGDCNHPEVAAVVQTAKCDCAAAGVMSLQESMDQSKDIRTLLAAFSGTAFHPRQGRHRHERMLTMPTYSGNGGGNDVSHSTCIGCQSLDAFVREMFQGPDLTALEKNLERNPYYPLLKLKEQGFRPIDVNAAELPTAAAPAVEATCSYQPTWRMGGGIYVRRHVDAVANEVDQQMAKFAAAEREVEQQKQEIRRRALGVQQPNRPRQETATDHGRTSTAAPFVRPEWIEYPLNPDCWSECSPRPDVIRLIEAVLPTFSPSTDPLAWQKVAELVRATGRTADQCDAMGWDELSVVFEIHVERLRSLLGRPATGCLARALDRTAAPPPDLDHEEGRGPTTCERLMALWGTEEGKCFLRTAKNIKMIAERIRRKPSVVKESPFFKSTVKPARNAHKSCENYEADEARERADRAREHANGRGGRRKSNRPRIRPTS